MSQNRTMSRTAGAVLLAAAAAVGSVAPAAAQQCGEWVVTRSTGAGATEAIAWTGDRFIALGGSVVSSFDGWSWQEVPGVSLAPRQADFTLGDVAANGVTLVAVGSGRFGYGSSGRIYTSDNGREWSLTWQDDLPLFAVAWGGGRWVAVGVPGILWSDDGRTWQRGEISSGPEPQSVFDIVYSGDRWVAVGDGGGGGWTATSENGATWSAIPGGPSRPIALASDGHRLMALGGGGVEESDDAVSWTTHDLSDLAYLFDLLWTGQRWLAAGYTWGFESFGFPLILQSRNGVNWEDAVNQAPSQEGQFARLVSSGERVVATGFGVPPHVSRDGVTWTATGPEPEDAWFGRIADDQGLLSVLNTSAALCMMCRRRQYLALSPDGVTWARLALPDGGWVGAAVRDGYVIAGSDGVMLSADGKTWNRPEGGVLQGTKLDGLAAGPPGLVAYSTEGLLLFSEDGNAWSPVSLTGAGFPASLRTVAWTGVRFVATSAIGIATSSDGRNWQAVRLPEIPNGLASFAEGGGRIVGVGWDGMAVVSEDGATWTVADTGAGSNLAQVVRTPTGFAVVSRDGMLLTSEDGIAWTSEWIAPLIRPAGLAVAGDRTVVVGEWGNIAIRDCPAPTLAAAAGTGPHDRIVPGAAHVRGVNGSAWRSNLVLSNPGSTQLLAEVWVLDGGAGNGQRRARQVAVPAGRTVAIHDVVRELFDGETAAGAIWVHARTPIGVASRTYTVVGAGTYGQNVPALGSLDTVTGSEQVVLPGLAETAGYRSNLGLANLNGEELTVRVEMRAADGSVLGEREYALPPYGWRQVDRVLREVTGDPVPLASAVLSGSGQDVAFAAYASVIDNASGDPVMTIPMAAVGEPIVFPAAAHTSGYGGVAWRTDLDVVNPGIEAAAYHLELLSGDGGGVAASPTVTLAPGAAVRYQDLLDTVFGVSGAGGVRVVPESGKVAATSRTYAVGAAGSYGQAVPGFPESRVAAGSGSGMLAGLSSSPADDAGFRTNIGAVNLTGEALTLHIDLYAGGGQLLGGKDLVVPAHGFAQTDRVFRDVVDTPVVDGYAVVGWEGEPGSLLPYASVVDNGTGDPVFIPAVPRSGDAEASR